MEWTMNFETKWHESKVKIQKSKAKSQSRKEKKSKEVKKNIRSRAIPEIQTGKNSKK